MPHEEQVKTQVFFDAERYLPALQSEPSEGALRAEAGFLVSKNQKERETIAFGKLDELPAGIGNSVDFVEAIRKKSNAEFSGVLRGAELARAYANMDVFAFPSDTDTFGNVVLEALASGVPTVVTSKGGPKFIIEQGQSGFIADDASQFTERVLQLAKDEPLRQAMAVQARVRALRASWDQVFASVYGAYERELTKASGGCGRRARTSGNRRSVGCLLS